MNTSMDGYGWVQGYMGWVGKGCTDIKSDHELGSGLASACTDYLFKEIYVNERMDDH